MVARQGTSGAGLGCTAATYGSSPGGGFGELDKTEKLQEKSKACAMWPFD